MSKRKQAYTGNTQNPKRTSGQFKPIPKLVKPESLQPTKGVTNNKLTKKLARLLVAGLILLTIGMIVIIATILS